MLLLDCKCATVLLSCSVSSFPRRLSKRTPSSQTKLFYRVKKLTCIISGPPASSAVHFLPKCIFFSVLLKPLLEKLFQKILLCIFLNFSFSQITNVLLIFFNYVEYLTRWAYFIQAALFMNQ